MFSESDWFWGLYAPLIVIGFVLGAIVFAVIPWAWPFVKSFIVWSLT